MRYRGVPALTACSAPGLWAATFSLLGYVISREHRPGDRDRRARGVLVFGALVAVDRRRSCSRSRFLREPENRGRLARGWRRSGPAAAVALGRRLSRRLRFLWQPADAGRARARVHDADGGARRWRCSSRRLRDRRSRGDPGPTPGDTQAVDVVDAAARRLAHRHRQGGDGARLDPGHARWSRSSPRWCWRWRRRWAELAVLVAALAICHHRGPGAQGADRPAAARGGLVEASGRRLSRAATPPTR